MPTESEQTEIATSVGKAQLLSLPVSAAIVVVLAVPIGCSMEANSSGKSVTSLKTGRVS